MLLADEPAMWAMYGYLSVDSIVGGRMIAPSRPWTPIVACDRNNRSVNFRGNRRHANRRLAGGRSADECISGKCNPECLASFALAKCSTELRLPSPNRISAVYSSRSAAARNEKCFLRYLHASTNPIFPFHLPKPAYAGWSRESIVRWPVDTVAIKMEMEIALHYLTWFRRCLGCVGCTWRHVRTNRSKTLNKWYWRYFVSTLCKHATICDEAIMQFMKTKVNDSTYCIGRWNQYIKQTT